MFTGIIENKALVVGIKENKKNLDFLFKTEILPQLKVDQSISHNGVCLTIVEILEDSYLVNVVNETLDKTNFSSLKIGDNVNIERSMQINGRLDGHIVQGHVDQVGECTSISEQGGSFLMSFKYANPSDVTVEKGSICINGISLTVFNSMPTSFTVAIIPYTWENTNLKDIKMGDTVNLEFDIIGKYISKLYFKS